MSTGKRHENFPVPPTPIVLANAKRPRKTTESFHRRFTTHVSGLDAEQT